jgi:hypothetical protein
MTCNRFLRAPPIRIIVFDTPAPPDTYVTSRMNLLPGPVCRDYEFVVEYRENKINREYHDEILMRLRSGMPAHMIVADLPVSRRYVHYVASRNGITARMADPMIVGIGRNYLSGYDVYEMYEVKKMTLNAIAKRAASTHKRVRALLVEMGVTIRPSFGGPGGHPPGSVNKRRKRVGPLDFNSRANHCSRDLNRYIGLAKWRAGVGARYLPVYEMITKGFSSREACLHAKVHPYRAAKQFKKMQRLYFAYLDYGLKRKVKIMLPDARVQQYQYVAEQAGISMLDWIQKTLSAAADKVDNRYDRTKPDRKSRRRKNKQKETEIGCDDAGVRSVHELPEPSDTGGGLAPAANFAGDADQARSGEGLGAAAGQ